MPAWHYEDLWSVMCILPEKNVYILNIDIVFKYSASI